MNHCARCNLVTSTLLCLPCMKSYCTNCDQIEHRDQNYYWHVRLPNQPMTSTDPNAAYYVNCIGCNTLLFHSPTVATVKCPKCLTVMDSSLQPPTPTPTTSRSQPTPNVLQAFTDGRALGLTTSHQMATSSTMTPFGFGYSIAHPTMLLPQQVDASSELNQLKNERHRLLMGQLQGVGSMPTAVRLQEIGKRLEEIESIQLKMSALPTAAAPVSSVEMYASRALELIGSSLDYNHPAMQYLRETHRREFTDSVRKQVEALLATPNVAQTTPMNMSQIIFIFHSIFNQDKNVYLKLQLDQRIRLRSDSTLTMVDDVRETLLGLLLYCLSRAPHWWSFAPSAFAQPTTPMTITTPTTLNSNSIQSTQMGISGSWFCMSKFGCGRLCASAAELQFGVCSGCGQSRYQPGMVAPIGAPTQPPIPVPILGQSDLGFVNKGGWICCNCGQILRPDEHRTDRCMKCQAWAQLQASGGIRQATKDNSNENEMATCASPPTPSTASSSSSVITNEEKFVWGIFVPLINGVIGNLKQHPFNWSPQPIKSTNGSSPSSSVSTPQMTSSILPLLMFSFLRPPFHHQLIPHIIQLIQIIYPDTASSHMLTSISSASVSSTIPRLDAQLALIRLFQQNPDFNSDLLPLIRLLRQAGATTKFTTNLNMNPPGLLGGNGGMGPMNNQGNSTRCGVGGLNLPNGLQLPNLPTDSSAKIAQPQKLLASSTSSNNTLLAGNVLLPNTLNFDAQLIANSQAVKQAQFELTAAFAAQQTPIHQEQAQIIASHRQPNTGGESHPSQQHVFSSDTSSSIPFSSGRVDTRRVNSWIYLSSWMSTQKLECLLSWLIEEYESNPNNLTQLYDPTYELDSFEDGIDSLTILAYVQRLVVWQPNHTPLHIYGELIQQLHQYTTHPSTSTTATSTSSISLTASSSSSCSTSTSSLIGWLKSTLSDLPHRCSSAFLLQRLLQINQCDRIDHDMKNSLGSPYARHSLRPPIHGSSSQSHHSSQKQLPAINAVVTDVIHLLAHSPQLFNLGEIDSSGNCLFHLLLSIPTAALTRLRPYQQLLQKKISELPPHLLVNNLKIEMLSTESTMPSASKSTMKTTLGQISLAATASSSSSSSSSASPAIYPYAGVELPTNNGHMTTGPLTIGRIFNCDDNQATDLLGLQYLHPYGDHSTPSIIIYGRGNEILLYLAPQDQRDQPRPTPGQLVTRMFPSPIRINPPTTGTKVLICLGWHRSEVGIFERELPLLRSDSMIRPGDILVTSVNMIDQIPAIKYPRPITFNAAPIIRIGSEAIQPYDQKTELQLRSQQLKQHRVFEAQMQQARQREQLIQQQRTTPQPIALIGGPQCQCCANDSFQMCTLVANGVIPCARCRTLGELCQQQQPPLSQQKPQPSLPNILSDWRTNRSIPKLACESCQTDHTACNVSEEWPCLRCRKLGRGCGPPSLQLEQAMPSLQPFHPSTASIPSNTNLANQFTSSSTIDGHGQTLPLGVTNRMTLITPGLLYGDALPTKRIIPPPSSFPSVTFSMFTLPLDFLLRLHSPYPRQEFIWSLYDTLLTVTLNHIHTTYPNITMEMIMKENLIGHLSDEFGRRWSSSLVETNMTELKVTVDLFQAHSIPMLVSLPHAPGSVVFMGNPNEWEDIWCDWIRRGQWVRIREWWLICANSTDGLWPTRAPGPSRLESLLETSKRLQQELSGSPLSGPLSQVVTFLQAEEQRWFLNYAPMFRLSVEDHLIHDLSEIVLEYLLPSPPPPSSTTSASALSSNQFYSQLFALSHNMHAQMVPTNNYALPNLPFPYATGPTVAHQYQPPPDAEENGTESEDEEDE